MKMIYADRAFESCETELSLVCCGTNTHVHFVERGIRFVKERIRCVRSILPKKIKKISSCLMRELVIPIVKMINSIRKKGRAHPVMLSRQVVTGRKLVLPTYPPGVFVYAVKESLSNSVD